MLDFRRSQDPYADTHLPRALNLGGALWAISTLAVLVLLPISPPTAAFGQAGWTCAAVIVAVALVVAWRMLRAGHRVSADELYALTLAGPFLIAALEYLAGGRGTPYHVLLIASIVYAAAVHPPRRVLFYMAAFVPASVVSALYAGGWSSAQAGEAILQTVVSIVLGFVTLTLMEAVRKQRRSLRAERDVQRKLAKSDSLTGLGNRRKLMDDVERMLATATASDPILLALYDLDGFKTYNDTFGHPAGDALLARLGERMNKLDIDGSAYRMGGDEFCVLARPRGEAADMIVRRARDALSESGEAFDVSASFGCALATSDHVPIAELLRTADRAMYAQKNAGRVSAGTQSADVLVSTLDARGDGLGEHLNSVRLLCERVAAQLHVPPAETGALLQAASLHDIGKVAIPDAILNKPSSLDDDEWVFMRRHTIVGERIVCAAPALSDAGRLVRSTHERWDGCGYPDNLEGEAIPLGARIIAVCDAYDAMVSDRAYRKAMSHEKAVAELIHCSGEQFDPGVVDAFCAAHITEAWAKAAAA
jgi:diguanylate cyclase (GGDEF)-like protein